MHGALGHIIGGTCRLIGKSTPQLGCIVTFGYNRVQISSLKVCNCVYTHEAVLLVSQKGVACETTALPGNCKALSRVYYRILLGGGASGKNQYSTCISMPSSGVWGHAPPGKFLILQPLRLLLVASESIILYDDNDNNLLATISL